MSGMYLSLDHLPKSIVKVLYMHVCMYGRIIYASIPTIHLLIEITLNIDGVIFLTLLAQKMKG